MSFQVGQWVKLSNRQDRVGIIVDDKILMEPGFIAVQWLDEDGDFITYIPVEMAVPTIKYIDTRK